MLISKSLKQTYIGHFGRIGLSHRNAFVICDHFLRGGESPNEFALFWASALDIHNEYSDHLSQFSKGFVNIAALWLQVGFSVTLRILGALL